MQQISHAYWISPAGDIYPVNISHIQFIFDNLQFFGISKEEFTNIFKKYNEPINWEGKARREIMFNALQKGWIRVREYFNKGWTVELRLINKNIVDNLLNWRNQILIYKDKDKTYYYSVQDISIKLITKENSEIICDRSIITSFSTIDEVLNDFVNH